MISRAKTLTSKGRRLERVGESDLTESTTLPFCRRAMCRARLCCHSGLDIAIPIVPPVRRMGQKGIIVRFSLRGTIK